MGKRKSGNNMHDFIQVEFHYFDCEVNPEVEVHESRSILLGSIMGVVIKDRKGLCAIELVLSCGIKDFPIAFNMTKEEAFKLKKEIEGRIKSARRI